MMKMKKILLFLFAAGLLLTACTEQVLAPGTDVVYYDYDVYSSQWQLWGDSYRAVLDVPDITRYVVTNGKVEVSRCYPGENNGIDIWTPLPCIRTEAYSPYAYTDGPGDEEVYYYTTFIDYEWTERTVSIYVTTSDLYTGDLPGDMHFRVFITQ